MDSKALIGIALMMLVYFVFLMPTPPSPEEVERRNLERIARLEADQERQKRALGEDSWDKEEEISEADSSDSSFERQARRQSIRLSSERLIVHVNAMGEIVSIELPQYLQTTDSEDRVRFDFFTDQAFNRLDLLSERDPIVWESVTHGDRELVLQGSSRSGLEIERRLRLSPDSTYSLKYVDQITNAGQRSQAVRLELKLRKEPSPDKRPTSFFMSLFSGPPDVDTVMWFEDQSLQTLDMKSVLGNSQSRTVQASVEWAGFSDKYFFKGFVPHNFDINNMRIGSSELSSQSLSSFERRSWVSQDIEASFIQIPPGQVRSLEYSFYLGPKRIPELQKITESLGRTVDYGNWIGPISRFLLLILLFFYSIIPNFGIAIILLTLVVKIVLFPLAWKAAYSMRKLSLVQPLMKEIQAKHKKDPQRLQSEMMALYKREKVNPIGGCFPLLLQMPVFFALYKLFFASFEMRHAPFFGWIQDLSSYDPLFVTPVLMVFLMYFQQKLTPLPTAGGEETDAIRIQKKLFKWMPFIFGAIMLFLPAGLTLYFLVNAGVSVVQQYYMNKRLDKILPRPANEVLKAANGQ